MKSVTASSFWPPSFQHCGVGSDQRYAVDVRERLTSLLGVAKVSLGWKFRGKVLVWNHWR